MLYSQASIFLGYALTAWKMILVIFYDKYCIYDILYVPTCLIIQNYNQASKGTQIIIAENK